MTNIPPAVRSDIDLFADPVLDDPHPTYKSLRDLGPAAYLNRHEVWFLGRYAETRSALADWKTFSSAQGIGLNATINAAWTNALICVDPPAHTAMRTLFTDRLGPSHLKPIEDTIERRAQQLADELIERDSFDAVKDLAHDLPINIIMDLIGWPAEVRSLLLELADGSFDTTISTIASGVWLFAVNPGQWDLLRADLSLAPQAFNETVRMESPIQHFSRVATRDVDLGEGVVIPAGARAIVSYASANREYNVTRSFSRVPLRAVAV